MPTIYILDDDHNLLVALTLCLPRNGYLVYSFTTSTDLLAALKLTTPDLMLLDVVLAEESDGKCLCLELRQKYHYANKIYLFSATHLQSIDIRNCEADGFIDKPFDLNVLLGTLNPALNRVDLV